MPGAEKANPIRQACGSLLYTGPAKGWPLNQEPEFQEFVQKCRIRPYTIISVWQSGPKPKKISSSS